MFEFRYDYVKHKYGKKPKLCFIVFIKKQIVFTKILLQQD